MAPAIKYVTTKDGYSIAYCDVGEGPALVWMPLPWNEQNFVWTGPLAPACHWLARDYRVITYDARGQGSSSRGLRDDHSLLDYLLDSEALVEHLDLQEVVIFGFYFYNTVALHYAVQHPRQVRALVLRSTSFDMSGSPHWLKLAEDSWDMLLYLQAQTWFRARPPNEIAARMRGWYTQSDFIKMARAAMYHDHKAAPLPQVPTLGHRCVFATR
jgi:pimeloyl-ACP methyl ester carboxylesterase